VGRSSSDTFFSIVLALSSTIGAPCPFGAFKINQGNAILYFLPERFSSSHPAATEKSLFMEFGLGSCREGVRFSFAPLFPLHFSSLS